MHMQEAKRWIDRSRTCVSARPGVSLAHYVQHRETLVERQTNWGFWSHEHNFAFMQSAFSKFRAVSLGHLHDAFTLNSDGDSIGLTSSHICYHSHRAVKLANFILASACISAAYYVAIKGAETGVCCYAWNMYDACAARPTSVWLRSEYAYSAAHIPSVVPIGARGADVTIQSNFRPVPLWAN